MANPLDVYQGLKERGFAPHIAAGIMGNMAVESAGFQTGINERNPIVKGSRGGFGLNQWTGPRRRKFEAFAQERGTALDDLDTQLDFTAFELNKSERAAGKALSRAATAEQAATIYSKRFLRPGIPHTEDRLAHTRGLFEAIENFEAQQSTDGQQQVADSGQIQSDAAPQFTRQQILDELQRRGEPVDNQPQQASPPQPDRAAIIAELERRGEDVSQHQTQATIPTEPNAGNEQFSRDAIIAELQRRGEDVSEFQAQPNPDGTFGEVPEGMIFDEQTGGFADTKAIAQRTRERSPFMGPVGKFIQGAPFVGEFFDEAVGAVAGPVQEGVTREIQSGFEEDNPKSATALRVAGGLVGSAPLVALSGPAVLANAPTSLAGQVTTGAALGTVAGATEGGISGAGRGNDGDRLATAKQDAFFGGALGTGFGALGPAVKAGAPAVLGWFRGTDVKKIAKELGIGDDAAKVIRNALLNDDLPAAKAAIARAGDNAMLSDAGRATQELLDAAVESGGNAGRVAREAIEDRAAVASGQMQQSLDRFLGKPQSVKSMQAGVRKGTQAARQAAYDAAYAQPINYAKGGRSLEPLLKRVPKDVIDKANRLMKIEGAESSQILAEIAEDGVVSFKTLPDVRQLDYITRALRDAAEAGQDAGALGGRTQASNALTNLSKAIRHNLRKLVPQYGKALDTAADAITETKALDAGYSLLRAATKRGDVVDSLSGMGKAERAAVKRGVRSYIDDTLANVGRVASDPNVDAREGLKLIRELSSRASNDKMSLVLGKKAATALGKELDSAATSLEVRAAIAKNSKTAIRNNIRETVSDISKGGVLRELSSGNPVNAAKRFVQVFTGNTPEAIALREAGIFEDIAKALTEKKGQQAQRAFRLAQKAIKGGELTDIQAEIIARQVATFFAVGGQQSSVQAFR